jgi:hypothetical protein
MEQLFINKYKNENYAHYPFIYKHVDDILRKELHKIQRLKYR